MYATLVWNITADFLVNVGYWIVSLFLFPFIEKEIKNAAGQPSFLGKWPVNGAYVWVTVLLNLLQRC